MGTEYETRVILDLLIGSLENRREKEEDAKSQRLIDSIIKEIETARDGRKTHGTKTR